MTVSAGAVPVSTVQLSEKDRHTILENVLAALKKRFYAPEKLNADWEAAVQQHRPLIESAATADAFEEAVSALLSRLQSSHLGFFHRSTHTEGRKARPLSRRAPTSDRKHRGPYSRPNSKADLPSAVPSAALRASAQRGI